MDSIMRQWFINFIDKEIEETNVNISNQKTWSLGGDPHGKENLDRLEEYKDKLILLKTVAMNFSCKEGK